MSLKLVSGSYDRSFKDFFIGENNTYSLSRIQFFLWVFLILSCQISIIAILVKNDSLTSYNFIIGSNVLWILAASFGTYLSVQGIANRKKEENKLLVKDTQKLSDILVDGNRLDFTKFQMALWTLIAVGIYFFNNITYVESINDTLQHVRASSKSLEDVTVFTTAVRRHAAKIAIVETYLDNAIEESSKAVADSVLRENKRIEMALLSIDSLHYLETASVETLILELHIINDSIASNKPRITTQPFRKVEYGHWTILETSFLKKIDLLFPVVTKERSDEVTSFNSQPKTYFSESADGQSSSVPDISLTFLILMGLVQGTYIGKKLLPTQPLDGGVTSETAAAPAANDFSPVTPTGETEFYELKLREAFKLAEVNFLPKPYVTGVDIGLKKVGGVTTDKKVIRIHVKEKLLPDKLSAEEKIPSMINGVPTDVIRNKFTRQDSPQPPAQALTTDAQRKTRLTKLQPGISVGDGANTGTLGLIVTQKNDPTTACIISNYHVLKSSIAIQPGTLDGGNTMNDTIGVKVNDVLDERGDASLIKITDATRSTDKTIFGTSDVLTGPGLPAIKQRLFKSGKESGITSGTVVADVGLYKVPGTTYVVKGFLIESGDGSPISIPGDSGSCWYDRQTLLGIGLHIGIDETGNAIACLLTNVLDALNAKL